MLCNGLVQVHRFIKCKFIYYKIKLLACIAVLTAWISLLHSMLITSNVIFFRENTLHILKQHQAASYKMELRNVVNRLVRSFPLTFLVFFARFNFVYLVFMTLFTPFQILYPFVISLILFACCDLSFFIDYLTSKIFLGPAYFIIYIGTSWF